MVEAKDLTVGRFFSKAIKDGSISDVDFDLILRQIAQYYTLKNQPFRACRSAAGPLELAFLRGTYHENSNSLLINLRLNQSL